MTPISQVRKQAGERKQPAQGGADSTREWGDPRRWRQSPHLPCLAPGPSRSACKELGLAGVKVTGTEMVPCSPGCKLLGSGGRGVGGPHPGSAAQLETLPNDLPCPSVPPTLRGAPGRKVLWVKAEP